jgi:hypothetical protein
MATINRPINPQKGAYVPKTPERSMAAKATDGLGKALRQAIRSPRNMAFAAALAMTGYATYGDYKTLIKEASTNEEFRNSTVSTQKLNTEDKKENDSLFLYNLILLGAVTTALVIKPRKRD